MASTVVRGRPPTKNQWLSLCEAMEMAGYTNTTLAEKMGVKPRTIGDWRRGTRVPYDPAIVLLGEVLGCDPDRLRRDAPVKKFSIRYVNSVQNAV